MGESAQYWNGRLARGRGQERQIPDGRLSSKTRQEWYAGWDEEDRLRAKPTPEQVADFNEGMSMLRDFLDSNGLSK
jgi:hypothetical protein